MKDKINRYNMFEKVLFPIDFSYQSLKTLECISEIPYVKEVVLLHVVDAPPSKHGWIYGPQVENSKIRIEEYGNNLKSLGLKVTSKVEVISTGHILETILDTADKEKVSLIVVNAHGKSIVKGLLLGSIALGVIRRAKTDVLIMRYKLAETFENKKLEKFCDRLFSKLLYPTDFSDITSESLSFIKSLKNVEIVLVHVVTKGETLEDIENNVEDAKKKIEVIKKDISDAGINVKEHIRVGNPVDEITSLAEEEDVSLIALSSHGKNWMKELLLGDTAYEVVKRSKRPVLLARVKK